MKNIFTLLFTLITIWNINSQSNYNDYNLKDIENVFLDNYNNNSLNNYIGRSNIFEASLINGKYMLENNSNVNWIKFLVHQNDIKFKAPKIKLDYSKDFEVETSFSVLKSSNFNQIFGLVIGANWQNFKIINKYQLLSFTNNKQSSVQQFNNNQYFNLNKWKSLSFINLNGDNKLTYRKVKNVEYYFINERLIHSKPFTKLKGENFGVIFHPKSKISIDYFRISYLKEPDKNPPTITITSPNVNRGFSIVKNNKSTTITGTIADESNIYEVLINGEDAYVDSNGKFSKNVILGVGENTFTVKATDIHMNSATKAFTIKREVEQTETTITNTTKINNTNSIETGKYYALIIGNNEYTDNAISTLDEPVKDDTKLYNVLTSKYSFSPQNVTLLKNATYVQMIDAFDKLSNTLTKNDNLLVFYAGHGWWDKKKNLGYWLPSNAKQSSTAFWIRNSTISDYMASIKSKHTLLIADACFSGSIFKTRSAFDNAPIAIKKLQNLPSKTAMTSGNLMEVPDKSVFLKYLVQRLEENTDKYLPADKLFASFRIAVMNNNPNAPRFGTIQNAGDEGGEFIFVKSN